MGISYELHQIGELGTLPIGSQIAVKSSFENLDQSLAFYYPLFSSDQYYYHHGVYLGDYKVIHFFGQDKDDAKPQICDIYRFAMNSADPKIYRVKYDDADHLRPVQDTLNLANEVLKEPSLWPGYHLVRNNCETFATWLKTGKKVSAQISFALQRVISLGTMVIGSSVGVAMSLRR